VDFATSGQHLKDAIWMTLQADSPGPIAFVSNWTAGVPSVFAKALAEEMESVESVALDILYYGNDRGGPDTAGAVDEFAAPFLAWRNNQWVTLKPLREGKRVHFPSGHEGTTYLINLPDLTSLVQATKASSVHVRLGLDAPVTNVLSSLLVRSRVWDVLPHSVRKSLLYNPGEGAPHEIVVEVKGIKEGRETTQTATLLSPQGQAHLTAIGAVHAVERVLGLDGKAPQRAGAVFSEAIGDCERLQELLTLEGVQWTRTESS
jgi:saccharopine dehydrogenase-like NADP-dependent oxidoreductase